MTTFLWNHLCRWLREDSIPGLHWRWKISQFSAYNFTNLFLLPQWVLSPKGQFCGCHRKIPTSPFISNPQGTIHRSCREAAGEGRGRRRKEQEGERLRGSVSPETSLPLASIALLCPLLQCMDPCPSIEAHFISTIWFTALEQCYRLD